VRVVELADVPAPVEPVLVAAFEGWNDAGEAATGAVEHLVATWEGVEVGRVDPEDYHDFQVSRPEVRLDEHGVRRLDWPTTRLYVARPPGSARDLVLVRGIEPSFRWRTFCTELLDAAERLGVDTVVTLGALLADVPHTRPTPVSGTSSDAALSTRLGLAPSRYEGPTGIVGVLQDAAQRSGFPSLSFWAAVPHYVAQPPAPKATVALLGRVEDLLDVPLPLGDLPEDARAWEHGVDDLAAGDADVGAYVRQLEQQRDESELPEASGDHIAREFERYLRRRDPGG
jgi:proteasome assembly chaperone (PAC2) family protein